MKKQIELHKKCIGILENINKFQIMKDARTESLDEFQGSFPELREKINKDIDRIDRWIERQKKNHVLILNKISHE